jgi:phage tail-like protein
MKRLLAALSLLAAVLAPVPAQAQNEITARPRPVADQIVCPVEKLEWGIAESFPDPWYALTYVETTANGPHTTFWMGKEMLACSYSSPVIPGDPGHLRVTRPYVDMPEEDYPCPPTLEVRVLSELPEPWLGTTYPWHLVNKAGVQDWNQNICWYEGERANWILRPVITDYPDIAANPDPEVDDLRLLFGVTNAQLAAVPAVKTTSCPTTVRFEGNIRTSGPGEVRYRFEENGQPGPLQTLDFDAAIGRAVVFETQVGTPSRRPAAIGGLAAAPQAPNVVTGQVRIVIESPDGVSESNMASYEITCSAAAAVGNLAQETPAPAGRREAAAAVRAAPASAARYSLVVDGQEIAMFSEATFNARANPPTVVLKGGRPIGENLRVWHEAAHTVQQGRPAQQGRKSASIVMYNYDGQPVARYHIENAWPSKMEIGGLRADSNEGLMETVTLTAGRIERVAP